MLLVPLIAMQFTSEVDWTIGDFAVFGVLLAALCLSIEGSVRGIAAGAGRYFAIAIAILAFLAIWALLATAG